MSAALVAGNAADDDVPIDVDPRSGRLLSVGELRRAMQLARREPSVTASASAASAAHVPAWTEHHEPGLPLLAVDGSTAVGWVVGSSGGSGETLLAQLLTGGAAERYVATGHRWPVADDRARVLLCARTNMRSLTDAQQALAQWAAGRLHAVQLVGMVLVADSPGKEPRPIQQFIQVLAGGVPRQWRLPWVGDWRLGPPEPQDVPKPVQTVLADIRSAMTTDDPST